MVTPKLTFRGVVLRGHSHGGIATRPTAPSGAARAPANGASARIRVGREIAGRGGKGVTVISGLPLEARELEALATRLKRLCGAGGAVRSGSIEIQGDHRDRVVAELQKLGYEARRSGG